MIRDDPIYEDHFYAASTQGANLNYPQPGPPLPSCMQRAMFSKANGFPCIVLLSVYPFEV